VRAAANQNQPNGCAGRVWRAMSSFESLLEHWIGGGEFVVDDDHGDTEAEAAAAAWSFLSFDIGAGYHPPEPAEEQPAPPLVDALQAETDHCASGTAGGSSDDEPGGKQSQTEASSLALSSEGHGGNGVVVPAVEENKDDGEKTRKKKIAFRTRSEVDVLDDGYRWHKYGKKMVKNSSNPRYRSLLVPQTLRACMHGHGGCAS